MKVANRTIRSEEIIDGGHDRSPALLKLSYTLFPAFCDRNGLR